MLVVQFVTHLKRFQLAGCVLLLDTKFKTPAYCPGERHTSQLSTMYTTFYTCHTLHTEIVMDKNYDIYCPTVVFQYLCQFRISLFARFLRNCCHTINFSKNTMDSRKQIYSWDLCPLQSTRRKRIYHKFYAAEINRVEFCAIKTDNFRNFLREFLLSVLTNYMLLLVDFTIFAVTAYLNSHDDAKKNLSVLKGA